MAGNAASLTLNGVQLPVRAVKLTSGKEMAALKAARHSGADHYFLAIGKDAYVASGAGLPTSGTQEGAPVSLNGQAGKMVTSVNAPNSWSELWDVEVPKIADRRGLQNALPWAAMFGGMGAMLGMMSGSAKAAVIAGLGLPAVLVGIPLALISYVAYKELKAMTQPSLTGMDSFGD
jgi:hypothetical protein